jgi:2'-5' RNA ligase
LRIFIAIEFDNDFKNNIKNIQNHLKAYSLQGNFSRIENFHITLKFIGEINISRLEPIIKATTETASLFNPFNICLNELGYFSSQNKKTIWIGIKDTSHLLENLANKLDNSLSLFGFEKEKREYAPHITLARQVILKENIDYIRKNIDIPDKMINVKQISVMESKREKGLLIYSPLYVISLK